MGRANIYVAATKRHHRIEDYETLRSAGMSFTEVLLKGHESAPDLDVRVNLVPALSSEYNSKWSLDAQTWDVPHPKKKVGRLHIVELSDYMSFFELLKTLAHEMVHVVQSHVGHLRITTEGEWFWKKRSFGYDPYEGSLNDAHLPWEREADRMQVTLAKRFAKASILT